MKHFFLIMTGIISMLFISCAGFSGHIAEPPDGEYVTGYVFEDRNNNGVMDEGERGIPGVLVSNQREVVQTDRYGRYYLPLEENMTVFVVKPKDYQLLLNENNLPQFYYHHFPQGSPDDLKFPGIEPTGNIPEYVNFPLIAQDDPVEIEVLVMGDPQPRDHKELDFMRDGMISEIREDGLTFGWMLGDIMFDDLSLFPRYNRLMSHIGIPLYGVIGNHDIDFEGDELHAKDNFRSYAGPNYYAFTYGNVHFFSLDNIEWIGKQTENYWGDYRGVIGEQQLTWISGMLENIPENELVVLGTHIPLYTGRSDSERNNTVDREHLFALLQDRDKVLTLAGHMHTNEYYFLGPEQGWNGRQPLVHIICGAGSGSWWGGPLLPDGYPYSLQTDGVPSGYYVVHFGKEGYQERFVPLGKNPGFQVRVSSPRGVISKNSLETTEIVVNVFMGNERTQVRAFINQEMEIPLQQTRRPDPFKKKLIQENRDTYKSWVRASPSVHIWSADLPADLDPGVYSIEIEAHLHDGRIFREKQVFEVIK